MRRYTHLGRSFSLAYVPHQILLALVVLAAVAAWVEPGGRRPAVAMLTAAATVALTWMLIREMEPDRAWMALLGATAAGGVSILSGVTDVAAFLSLLLAARILVRSTGLVPRLTDIVAVGLFAGVFARTPLAWAAGLAVAASVALDTNSSQPAPARYSLLALAIGVAVTISATFSDALDLIWTTPDLTTGLLAAAALGLLLSAPRQPSSRNDVVEPYAPDRVQATHLLIVAATALGTLAGGGQYAPASWPVWIALVTAGVSAHLGRWSD